MFPMNIHRKKQILAEIMNQVVMKLSMMSKLINKANKRVNRTKSNRRQSAHFDEDGNHVKM